MLLACQGWQRCLFEASNMHIFFLQVGSNEFVFQCLSVLTDCAKFETLFRRKETDTLSVSHGDRQQKGGRDKG